jgi:monoamine oxidase
MYPLLKRFAYSSPKRGIFSSSSLSSTMVADDSSQSSRLNGSCGSDGSPYDPVGRHSLFPSSTARLAALQEKLHCEQSLRLQSIRHTFSYDYLKQFYDDLMIPNFPLERERDAFEDWLECLYPKRRQLSGDDPGPDMDVILLLAEHEDTDPSTEAAFPTAGDGVDDDAVVVAGIAFEYYKMAQTGLVSYMVVADAYRRRGIVSTVLHPIALEALQSLHEIHNPAAESSLNATNTIRAVFAETNTVDAGDATVAEIRRRHVCLHRLGYRLLAFPYVQPPLEEGCGSFDEIMLLLYTTDCEGNTNTNATDGHWTISTKIAYDYILDFYQSVFGYHSRSKGTYDNHWYYKVATYFLKKYQQATIVRDLPWNDCTDHFRREYESSVGDSIAKQIVVVGAGIAGLTAAIQIVKQAKNTPVCITVLEANSYVGGRIRTVVTCPDAAINQHVIPCAKLQRQFEAFAPWPVAIGAEFVHGINSGVNRLIEKQGWEVEETFNLCSEEECPNDDDNSFLKRSSTRCQSRENRVKVFAEGRLFDWREMSNHCDSSDFPSLFQTACEIWDTLIDINKPMDSGEEVPKDKSLDDFVSEQLAGKCTDQKSIETVKGILEALFANTAASDNQHYGVHEASREEEAWDYSECNFRTKQCFAELIVHCLAEIDTINNAPETIAKIKVETDSPVVRIHHGPIGSVQVYKRNGIALICDKVVVTVPLAILKEQWISFEGLCTIPADKQNAIDTVNMFSGMKVHLLLKVGVDIRSKPDLFENTDFFFCPGEQFFTQVWLRRDDDSVFVTGFVVAKCRERLLDNIGSNSDGAKQLLLQLIYRILSSVDDMPLDSWFPNPERPTCSAFALHDWSEDDFVGGLYSSPSIGAGWQQGRDSQTMRHLLAAPIMNTVFFAGEHTSTKTSASVQAAMESGERVAAEILQSFGPCSRQQSSSPNQQASTSEDQRI